MRKYKALNRQTYHNDIYSIVPIRHEDRYCIMKWRNEQMYHLRQASPLTKQSQDHYYNTVINSLFEEECPSQLLFSYLENGKCIGYGGLVHINWIDKNAEVSFIMNTELEKNTFQLHWSKYLKMLDELAFEELNLHKIYTYAFDLRPHLYEALERADYIREACLKEHCFFEGEYKDVVIHSKNRNNYTLTLKDASIEDSEQLFDWANDPTVRELSFNNSNIEYATHQKWFKYKLNSQDCSIFIFHIRNWPVGQVRIEKESGRSIIGISIDKKLRGKGLAPILLRKAINHYWIDNKQDIIAYIKPDNKASIKAFEICGFAYNKTTTISGCFALEYCIKRNSNE